MKTLVTGASGFLGTHLVAELCRRGDPKDIRVYAQSAAPRLEAMGVEIVRGSVLDANATARAVAGVSRVYHLAGLVSRKAEDGHRMFSVHVEGTRLLCEAAKKAGCKRMVLASTSGTIAVSERPDPSLDEESPAPIDLVSRWPYYASKLYQEETARRVCGSAVELVMVNPSLLLGPGDDRLSSTRDILSFLAREIPLVPTGGLSFVDVRDVAAVMPVAMERGRPGARYLLGAYNWTFAEYFGRLARLTKVAAPRLRAPGRKWTVLASRVEAEVRKTFGGAPKIAPESVEMASYFWYFSSKQAHEELGFAPREATETLFDTVAYIRRRFLPARPLVADTAVQPAPPDHP